MISWKLSARDKQEDMPTINFEMSTPTMNFEMAMPAMHFEMLMPTMNFANNELWNVYMAWPVKTTI